MALAMRTSLDGTPARVDRIRFGDDLVQRLAVSAETDPSADPRSDNGPDNPKVMTRYGDTSLHRGV